MSDKKDKTDEGNYDRARDRAPYRKDKDAAAEERPESNYGGVDPDKATEEPKK